MGVIKIITAFLTLIIAITIVVLSTISFIKNGNKLNWLTFWMFSLVIPLFIITVSLVKPGSKVDYQTNFMKMSMEDSTSLFSQEQKKSFEMTNITSNPQEAKIEIMSNKPITSVKIHQGDVELTPVEGQAGDTYLLFKTVAQPQVPIIGEVASDSQITVVPNFTLLENVKGNTTENSRTEYIEPFGK